MKKMLVYMTRGGYVDKVECIHRVESCRSFHRLDKSDICFVLKISKRAFFNVRYEEMLESINYRAICFLLSEIILRIIQ